MSLASRIEADLKTAMKARDTETVPTLRMVLASMKNLRAESGHSEDVTDEEMLELLGREAKRRGEAARAYDEAGREDLAAKERAELEVLKRYLPEELDDAELRATVDAAIEETGASGPSDFGKVMGAVMPNVKGRADGSRVNAVVRERLGA